MNIYFPNDSFSLENLLAGKINQKNFTDSEKHIVTYVLNWFNGLDHFTFLTSGSTGNPKSIQLSREQLEYSASSTLDYLYPNSKPSSLLLAINPKFIGGTQVITRAIISNADLIYQEPSSNPLGGLSKKVDLASFVPLQIRTICEQDPLLFEKVGSVLIGGASLDEETAGVLSQEKTRFFQTYGMTETASNVALKGLQQDFYEFIGDIEHHLDDRGCLCLKGTVTNKEWLLTNDMVELVDHGFKWKGRVDWVINTGGMKIHPEKIEKKIRKIFPNDEFFITKAEDTRLGEKVVICSLSPLLKSIQRGKILGKYETPKEEFLLKEFPMTASGKIDRRELQALAESNARIIGNML